MIILIMRLINLICIQKVEQVCQYVPRTDGFMIKLIVLILIKMFIMQVMQQMDNH